MTPEDRENKRFLAALAILFKIVEEGDYGDLQTEIASAIKGADQLLWNLEHTRKTE